eukprot:6931570-Prymnesium_polylepis.1
MVRCAHVLVLRVEHVAVRRLARHVKLAHDRDAHIVDEHDHLGERGGGARHVTRRVHTAVT